MTSRSDSPLLILLVQTLLVCIGGFLFVSLLAKGSTMSQSELLIGPLSIALLWLGIAGAKPIRREPSK